MTRGGFALVLLLAMTSGEGVAQQPLITPTSELEDYLRLIQLQEKVLHSAFTIRSASSNAILASELDSAHLWDDRYPLGPQRNAAPALAAIAPEALIVLNSGYPRGRNDGAIWAGKGATVAVSAGALVRWGPLTATLYPTVYRVGNADFALAPVPAGAAFPFVYPHYGGDIDYPQRHGDEAFTKFDWGQTGVRIDLGAFTAGIGTENIWLGPAFRNGVIMSSAAPGFPHLDVGTGRPVWIGVGSLEVRGLYGVLQESEYYDTNSGNNTRFLARLALNYQPKWIPGLWVGGQRVAYKKWSQTGAQDVLAPFGRFFREAVRDPNTGVVINDSLDQLLSVHARWVFPQVGFEAYLEWARNDFSGNLRDFLLEPDHSSGYTVGLSKTLSSGEGTIALRGELTHLGRLLPREVRASPTYYVHGLVSQGYTHRGQLLGAWIGPGSNSEFFGIDRYDSGGRVGLFLERVRFDDDAYFATVGPALGREGHEVELTVGLSVYRFVGPVDLGVSFSVSRDLNRYFEVRNDVTNVNAQLRVAWSRW
jgi:hypothetical protein